MDTEPASRTYYHRFLRFGRDGRAGCGNPDEFYVKENLLNKKPAVRRNLGSKMQKMIYGAEGGAGKSVEIVDVDKDERIRYCLTDAQVENLSRQAIEIEKHYGMPMDISGRWMATINCTSFRPVRKP